MYFVSDFFLAICSDYYSGLSVGNILNMYSDETIKQFQVLYDTAVINEQTKIKFYGRDEKDILKTKSEEM
jgi:hypothetical protein